LLLQKAHSARLNIMDTKTTPMCNIHALSDCSRTANQMWFAAATARGRLAVCLLLMPGFGDPAAHGGVLFLAFWPGARGSDRQDAGARNVSNAMLQTGVLALIAS
jgi:hypothetical protein